MNQAYWDTERLRASQGELVERIAGAISEDGSVEPLPGLLLIRASTRVGPIYGVSRPSFCMIAQGGKEVLLGESVYHYDPARYLLATAELPVVGQITEASAARPYLGLRLELDPALVGSVMVEAGLLPSRKVGDVRAVAVSALGADLLESVLRLVRLLNRPGEVRVLQPLITREIVYRLLIGAQGDRLRQLTLPHGHTDRIVQVLQRLRREFNQPLRMDDLAREVGMSISGFHTHFKAVTGMSPLQFQKQLRLQEARRLMLGEGLDASNAGYRVGYDDASQFSREYKRLFGEPPLRDATRLRTGGEVAVAAQP